jgi:hypothetical protein
LVPWPSFSIKKGVAKYADPIEARKVPESQKLRGEKIPSYIPNKGSFIGNQKSHYFNGELSL